MGIEGIEHLIGDERTLDVRKGHEIFQHECRERGCTTTVVHDDEPYCDHHSKPGQKCVPGYSARREADQKDALGMAAEASQEMKDMADNNIRIRKNIFDK